MPDLQAKGVAATVAFLLVAVIAILTITSNPPAGGTKVTAEFDNAFPLIEGMHVRVDGAIAGSVANIEVNDQGNAEVELSVNSSVEDPAADASAAIRQQDTTGDSYVAYDPGKADEPLPDNTIPCETHDSCSNTLVAPRLDDLLNAFGPAERTGVQLILVELSKALDRRGKNLNEAALELRPAIENANQALAEVNQQNAALKSLISSAESVTGQVARKDKQLGQLIEGLATTTNVTAAESAALDAGLEALPETTRRAQTTLASLTRAAVAGKPLADDLAVGAPDLAGAVGRLPGFLDNASSFLSDTRPILDLTGKVLRAAEPALKIGKERVITGPFDLTGATADLLNSVLGGEDAFPALFGDDSYGEGEGTLGKRGFGAVAVEPGNLPGYPASHEPRNWLRVSAVLNCEVFGVKIRPGCLADVLSPVADDSGSGGRSSASDRIAQALEARGAGKGGRGGASGTQPGAGSKGADGPIRDLDLEGLGLGEIGKGIGKTKKGKRPKGKGKNKDGRGIRGSTDAYEDLLDFLFK